MTRFYIADCETGKINEVSRSAFFDWLSIMKQEENPFVDCGGSSRVWRFNRVSFVMMDC